MQCTFTSEITVRLIQKMGGDNMLAAAAWVSTTAEEGLQRAVEKPDDVPGVINYLVKHRHGTPFEHGAMTIFVHAPIFVWREWHRHRIGFSYNEESARYKTLDPVFYMPPPERPMFKVDNWKPGRPKFLTIKEFNGLALSDEYSGGARYKDLVNNLGASYELAYEKYQANLALGIDPGLARDCLPVGIYSSCWVTCNPRSIMAFLSLRVHDPASTFVSYPLHEIDQAARKLEAIFAEHFPITHAAFVKNGRVAP